jgi:hypothetical protein
MAHLQIRVHLFAHLQMRLHLLLLTGSQAALAWRWRRGCLAGYIDFQLKDSAVSSLSNINELT